eukprot:gene8413-208_t
MAHGVPDAWGRGPTSTTAATIVRASDEAGLAMQAAWLCLVMCPVPARGRRIGLLRTDDVIFAGAHLAARVLGQERGSQLDIVEQYVNMSSPDSILAGYCSLLQQGPACPVCPPPTSASLDLATTQPCCLVPRPPAVYPGVQGIAGLTSSDSVNWLAPVANVWPSLHPGHHLCEITLCRGGGYLTALCTSPGLCCPASISGSGGAGSVGPESHRMPIVAFYASSQILHEWPFVSRPIPSDDKQAECIISVLRHYGWMNGISITSSLSVALDTPEVVSSFLENRAAGGGRIIVYFGSSNFFPAQAVKDTKTAPMHGFTWVFSEAVPLSGVWAELAFEGSLGIKFGTSADSLQPAWNALPEEIVPVSARGAAMPALAAVAFEGISLLASVLMDSSPRNVFTVPAPCGLDSFWSEGDVVASKARSTRFRAADGTTVRMDPTGTQSDTVYILDNLVEAQLPPGRVAVLKEAEGFAFFPDGEAAIWNPSADLDRSTGVPSAFSKVAGSKLRVGFAPNDGWWEKSPDGSGWQGFGAELVAALADIAGFEPRLVNVRELPEYGGCSWTTQTHMGSTLDMFGPDATVTPERLEFAAFLRPVLPTNLQLLVRRPPTEPVSMTAFMSPFSYGVWLSIVFIVFVMGVAWWVVESLTLAPDFMQSPVHHNLGASLWGSVMTMLTHDFWADKARSNAGRLITFGMGFTGLVFISAYTANLVNFITQPAFTFETDGMQDFLGNRLPLHRLGIHLASGSKGTAYSEWADRNLGSGYTRSSLPTGEILQGLPDVYGVLTDDISIQSFAAGSNCTQMGKGSLVFPQDLTFAVPKKWPFTGELDSAVLQLQRTGWIRQALERWFPNNCPPLREDHERAEPLSTQNFYGVYLTLLFISCAAIAMSCGSFVFTRKVRSKFGAKPKPPPLSDYTSVFTKISNNPSVDKSTALSKVNSASLIDPYYSKASLDASALAAIAELATEMQSKMEDIASRLARDPGESEKPPPPNPIAASYDNFDGVPFP